MLERELTDGRHDLFTRAGLGHLAGKLYAMVRPAPCPHDRCGCSFARSEPSAYRHDFQSTPPIDRQACGGVGSRETGSPRPGCSIQEETGDTDDSSSGPSLYCLAHVGTLGGELWKFSASPCTIQQQSDSQNYQPFTALRRNQNVWLVYLDELRSRLCDA